MEQIPFIKQTKTIFGIIRYNKDKPKQRYNKVWTGYPISDFYISSFAVSVNLNQDEIISFPL